MSMTPEEKAKCAKIIHGHAVASAGGNLVPIPGVGYAADVVTMASMAMALSGVFGGSLEENVAKNMAIAALKQQLLKQPIKSIAKEIGKVIPFIGQAAAASVSVAMLEGAGWTMAEELASKRK